MLTIRRLLIALALLGVAPATSSAVIIFYVPNPLNPFTQIPVPVLTCTATRAPNGTITYTVDPLNVESFQLDVAFDPNDMSFQSLSYVSPYVQTTSPDLSQLGSGLLRDVAGTSSISPPPPGDVDIFVVTFMDLRPDPSIPTTLTVFGSSNDYVVALDTETSDSVMFGGDTIQSCADTIPEPATVTLFALGGLILLACGRRWKSARGT